MKTFKQALKKVSPIDQELLEANIKATRQDRIKEKLWTSDLLRIEEEWRRQVLNIVAKTPLAKLPIEMQANNLTALAYAFEYGMMVGRAMYDNEKL